MTKKNKEKRNKSLIIIIVIVVVLGTIGVLSVRKSASSIIDDYDVVEVTRQDMKTTVRGSGVVESRNKLDVYSPANIIISQVYVENGDEISIGDAIAKIDKDAYLDAEKAITDSISQIDTSINSMYSSKGSTSIYSSVKGTVKLVYIAQEDMVEAVMNKNDSLIVISADNNMKIELVVEDTDGYEEGDKVSVKIDDDEADATITEIDFFESTLKIIFEDNEYEVGQEVDVLDADSNKIGSAPIQINVPVYVVGDAGVARYVYVEANQAVSTGTKLISIKDNGASGNLISLTEQKENLQRQMDEMKQELKAIGLAEDYIIYSQGEGIVDEMMLTPYMAVAEGMKMFVLQSTHPLMMHISIDELDIAQVELGQMVELKFEALAGDKYDGEITRINSLGESINGVTSYTIEVIIIETGDILIGMSGNAKILTEEKKDVLTIPVEAVQLIDDEYYVIMGEDANIITVADHKITTGLNDGAYIEVIEGLTDGDTVAVPQEKELEIIMGPGR